MFVSEVFQKCHKWKFSIERRWVFGCSTSSEGRLDSCRICGQCCSVGNLLSEESMCFVRCVADVAEKRRVWGGAVFGVWEFRGDRVY